jgi:hypothetical protein
MDVCINTHILQIGVVLWNIDVNHTQALSQRLLNIVLDNISLMRSANTFGDGNNLSYHPIVVWIELFCYWIRCANNLGPDLNVREVFSGLDIDLRIMEDDNEITAFVYIAAFDQVRISLRRNLNFQDLRSKNLMFKRLGCVITNDCKSNELVLIIKHRAFVGSKYIYPKIS